MTSELMDGETEESRMKYLYILRGEFEYVKRISRTESSRYAKGLFGLLDMDVPGWNNRREQYISYYNKTGQLKEENGISNKSQLNEGAKMVHRSTEIHQEIWQTGWKVFFEVK